mgnify:CR=1 FL=1
MKKRALTLLLTAALSAGLLAGCGSSSDSSAAASDSQTNAETTDSESEDTADTASGNPRSERHSSCRRDSGCCWIIGFRKEPSGTWNHGNFAIQCYDGGRGLLLWRKPYRKEDKAASWERDCSGAAEYFLSGSTYESGAADL